MRCFFPRKSDWESVYIGDCLLILNPLLLLARKFIRFFHDRSSNAPIECMLRYQIAVFLIDCHDLLPKVIFETLMKGLSLGFALLVQKTSKGIFEQRD